MFGWFLSREVILLMNLLSGMVDLFFLCFGMSVVCMVGGLSFSIEMFVLVNWSCSDLFSMWIVVLLVLYVGVMCNGVNVSFDEMVMIVVFGCVCRCLMNVLMRWIGFRMLVVMVFLVVVRNFFCVV